MKSGEGRHCYALPTAVLTPREVEVSALLIEGLLVKEAAFRLGISAHTAECHRANAYRKLRVHSRVELLKALQQLNHETS